MEFSLLGVVVVCDFIQNKIFKLDSSNLIMCKLNPLYTDSNCRYLCSSLATLQMKFMQRRFLTSLAPPALWLAKHLH